MPIHLKKKRDLEKMRAAGKLVAESFALLGENIKPGVSLEALDHHVESFLLKRGAKPLYKGYKGSSAGNPPFPATICASVNDEICHGIPDSRILQDGDVIGIDIGLRYRGFCGDACVTFPVGQVAPEVESLLDIGRECLRVGIDAADKGSHMNDVGRAIEAYATSQGVSVVREWGGHGIGRQLHEEPSVSHVRLSRPGPRLRPGMVFTIEPMINAGRPEWSILDDGWTVATDDGSLSVQFEHTIALTDNGVEILTIL